MEIGTCPVCGKFCGSARHAFAEECRDYGHSFGVKPEPGVYRTCRLCGWTEPHRDKRGRFARK
jgi:hypothetical protein